MSTQSKTGLEVLVTPEESVMKAIVFDRFGGTEVLHEADIEVPQPGPGQVRVRVKAAGVNALDGKTRSGMLEAVRPTTLPAVPGGELAGVVDALGEGVTDVQVGDEVLGWSDTGSYAQYALATTVAPKPAGLDWQDAAALPVASKTAERVLNLLGVAAGETVLMHGASGGVGTLAIQLATAAEHASSPPQAPPTRTTSPRSAPPRRCTARGWSSG